MKVFAFIILLFFSTQSLAIQDFGVDIGIVIPAKTKLRSEASKESAELVVLKKGNVVVLLNKEETDGWLNVVDVDSAKEGWLLAKTLNVQYTQNPSKGPNFQTEFIPELTAPEVSVKNASNIDLNLKVGSQIYPILANSQKVIPIQAGLYKYYASAPGVIPALGERNFEVGYRYSWEFWVETRYSRGTSRTRR
jgi:uncharacterized protein YgiM (DUF1202 family)